MPRRPRVFLPGQPIHLIQRGHNRCQVFFGQDDAKAYLGWLQDAASKHGLYIHAYVLMTNHVHLLVSPASEQALPKALRDVNWHYTRHINAAHDRSGSLWDGRYKACIVEADTYLIACCRYIEFNPVRAGLAQGPASYRWSSHKANAEGATNPLLTPHPLYTKLGNTPADRAAAYREMCKAELPESTVHAIRTATNGGWALGKDAFAEKVGRHAGRNMAPRGPGRPWPQKDKAS